MKFSRKHDRRLRTTSHTLTVEQLEHRHLLATDLLAHLAEVGLSRYDMPEWFIALDEFPLTASGKVLKRELIEWVKRGVVTPERVGREGRAWT